MCIYIYDFSGRYLCVIVTIVSCVYLFTYALTFVFICTHTIKKHTLSCYWTSKYYTNIIYNYINYVDYILLNII